MTRAQICDKYDIVMLENPSVANKELSEKEAASYEEFCKLMVEVFNETFDDSSDCDSCNPDNVDDKSIAKIINDSLENGLDENQVPYPDPRKY